MFLQAGDRDHLVMAAMLGIFGLALAAIARDMNRVHVQSLGLRFDNDGLIRTLFKANEAAQSAVRAKSVFLASMSHELRTPLNAILGFSEIMRDELFGPLGSRPYREYAVLIHESAEHLLDVISDVLDASKAETGTLAIEGASSTPPRWSGTASASSPAPSPRKASRSRPRSIPTFRACARTTAASGRSSSTCFSTR
jgi:signal transduction histidine kinase